MTRRMLVVCTANVCRSPSVERLLRRRLDGVTDIDGEPWSVSSAGVGDLAVAVERQTVAAGHAAGIDLTDHERRVLTRQVLGTDGADLVIGMTREHVRAVIGLDPQAWSRTYTLKELVRRASAIDPPTHDEGYEGWRNRLAEGRKASEMVTADPIDDIEDPYGRPQPFHDQMMSEVSTLVDGLVRVGPWRNHDASGASRTG